MQRRAKRIFIIALLISLLMHTVLLTGVRFALPVNDEPDATVIEARLLPLPVPAPKPVKIKVAPKPIHHSKPRSRPATPPPPIVTAPVSESPPIEPEQTQTASDTPSDTSPATDNTPVADTPALNALPGKIEIQYKVVKGTDGFAIGRASYIWVAEAGRYTLTSITEGTGIFSLFLPGKLVQISRGKITPFGLAPDDFWIQRGRATPDKTTAAHFDYARKTVTITKNNQAFSVPLQDNAQDVLSVIFQLAVRSPFPDAMLLHVTTGKSLKPYHALVVGEEIMNTALGELNVLHLSRPAEEDEDAMDVWLAEDYNFVPVKIRINHSKYGVIEQVITGMRNN
ncbi:hypothetical protein CAP31_00975 [Sulfuriferula sp. AH1]|uniref:DUF3108 domain-containing protein n=1 Tax=Sulfuriferula sp. AH1 TaxID=1985873 RepID=UPI000B3B3D28|nr:DUF3108 domain-containing protein [Sulfuriferula sp. AH1]ARU30389.1 hypothetical protein CAP31_00975 [Sulfuriferula sp. AH1]